MSIKPLKMMTIEELDIETAKTNKHIADLKAKLDKIQKIKDEKSKKKWFCFNVKNRMN